MSPQCCEGSASSPDDKSPQELPLRSRSVSTAQSAKDTTAELPLRSQSLSSPGREQNSTVIVHGPVRGFRARSSSSPKSDGILPADPSLRTESPSSLQGEDDSTITIDLPLRSKSFSTQSDSKPKPELHLRSKSFSTPKDSPSPEALSPLLESPFSPVEEDNQSLGLLSPVCIGLPSPALSPSPKAEDAQSPRYFPNRCSGPSSSSSGSSSQTPSPTMAKLMKFPIQTSSISAKREVLHACGCWGGYSITITTHCLRYECCKSPPTGPYLVDHPCYYHRSLKWDVKGAPGTKTVKA